MVHLALIPSAIIRVDYEAEGAVCAFVLSLLWQRIQRRPLWHLLWLAALAIVLGAVAFAWTQHISLFTALYWAVTTAATVGYGDVTPHDVAGRLIAMGVMVTAIPLMAAVFASWSAALASNRVRRILGMDQVQLRNHLVVFGYNSTVSHMLDDLSTHHLVLLVADVDPATVPSRVQLLAGDPTQSEVVERARPERAVRALVAGSTDAAVLMTAVLVKHFAPKLNQTALVQSSKVAAALADLGVRHSVATDDLIGHTVAKTMETPHAGDLLLKIIGDKGYALREKPVHEEWVGQSFSQVRQRYRGVVLGLLHNQEVVLGVDRDPKVEAGDQVFVLESDA